MDAQKKVKIIWRISFLLLWAAQMAAALWFCVQKQGFHEDEFYTYYSTARTNGFYVEDGAWMEREAYQNEFVVLPGQGFQYGYVKQVQSWDVHPPLYYWAFHTAASLAPGVFSKWIGLSVNLFFHGINLILLPCLSYFAGGQDRWIAFLTMFLYGFSPAALSGVTFIRMYEMLTVFVLLSAILHVRAVTAGERRLSFVKTLFPMGTVTYLGFLTQYYYFIFLFFLGAAFLVWMLFNGQTKAEICGQKALDFSLRDRILNCFGYGCAQGIALLLAWLTYPACLGQMFRGQRGAQATANFFDLSNTFERLLFFLNLINGHVFGGLLFVILPLLFFGALFVFRKRNKTTAADKVVGAACPLLLAAAAGYFLTVAKTGLLLGGTSIRYQLPICGIAVFLVLFFGNHLWGQMRKAGLFCGQRSVAGPKKNPVAGRFAAGILLGLVALFSAHLRTGVLFLYPENAAQMAFSREWGESDAPVVYLYQPGEEWCVWAVADQLFSYKKVYFAAAGGGAIEEPEIAAAPSLVVYLAKGADPQRELARLRAGEGGLRKMRLRFAGSYCEAYELR